MNTKNVAWLIAAVALGAGGFYAYSQRGAGPIPGDLRDAVADKGFDTSIPVFEENAGNMPEPEAVAVDAERGQAKAVKSVFSGLGQAAADSGPLFGVMAERNAQTKGVDLRFGDESPKDVLKRMFEAGTQPKTKDLIGVVEGRLFVASYDEAETIFLIGREGEEFPNGGPLFADKRSLFAADFVRLSRDGACDTFKSGEDLDPVRFEGGSAITEWSEGTITGVLEMRMNSGYIIIHTAEKPGNIVNEAYGYHFKKVQCDK